MGVMCRVLGAVCGLTCVGCPCVIAWLSTTYAETGCDDGFDPWPVHAIDTLNGVAAVATAGLIMSLRLLWSARALLALPLLCLTTFLAVTGGMWVEGTYF